MDIFSRMAERKIMEAIEHGEFDHLENTGRPLDLDDDAGVPQDLRLAYRILKNSGCLPPELQLRNEIISLRDLLGTIDGDQDRMKKVRELNFKLLKLSELRKKPFFLHDFPEYEEKISRKLTRGDTESQG